MFTGPVGPVELCFYLPEAVLGDFLLASGLELVSSPVVIFFMLGFTFRRR